MRVGRRGMLCGAIASLAARAHAKGAYRCPPCGCAEDGRVFDRPGRCPACGMDLVVADAPPPPLEPPALPAGTSLFLMRGGVGREAARITVACHRPRGFGPASPVLLVLPGAGRNAASYLKDWLEVADAKGVLVAALGYPEADYDLGDYQFGGIVRGLSLRNLPPGGALPDSLHVADEDIVFAPNPRSETWLFADFDRVFAHLVRVTGSRRTGYDLFGHSAGGQIAHRAAMLGRGLHADRIVAANAGTYSLPDLSRPLLLGVQGTGAGEADLRAAFARRLTILLGALDNDPERGGQHLHTPLFDATGLDRLSRGRFFFRSAQATAQRMEAPFNWMIEEVPGVGHDHAGMAAAAARLLYG